MPNWITVQLKADNVVLNSFINEDGNFDFEKIIRFKGKSFDMISLNIEDEAKRIVDFPLPSNPMLRALEVNSRNESKFNTLNLKDLDVLFKMLKNYKKYGFFHQMDFAIEKWGTKWNACDSFVNLEESYGTFKTAWSCPIPFLLALSNKFPKEIIEIEYADEDIGSNCGTFVLKGGSFISENIAPNYQEMTDDERSLWKKFAYRVTEKNPEDYE